MQTNLLHINELEDTPPAFFDLVDQAELRNKLIDRVDVLNKVKELFLIPKLEMMTAQMVADFYEVNSETIRQLYHRNQTEIDSDGVIKYSPKDFERDMLSRVKIERSPIVGKVGYTTFIVDGEKVTLGNGSQRYFTPRAVLRIGMLLRDSPSRFTTPHRYCNLASHDTGKERSSNLSSFSETCYLIYLFPFVIYTGRF